MMGKPGGMMTDPEPIRVARRLVERAILDRLFPAAVVEAGDGRAAMWREAFGRVSFNHRSAACTLATIFDLASLAKPIATTSVVLQLASEEKLGLGDFVSAHFAEWQGADRSSATIQDLLEHAAGLSARLVDVPPSSRREFEHEICMMPLEYQPRSQSVYTDLGFILLGFLAEDRGEASLAKQFAAIRYRVWTAVGHRDPLDELGFDVPLQLHARTAPTLPMPDDVRRGRALVGEVHDNYAAALGGIAGHAGLFGTGGGVGAFARAILRAARDDESIPTPLTPRLVALSTRRSSVPGSSRALGWDTMLPTSSCGTEMSPAAFGHVGFTGTSVWIDPILDRYFVLLTNRVNEGGTSDEMQSVRRAFHNALAKL
jgi:CubicO group peptidase (beta-lactamase class C family)